MTLKNFEALKTTVENNTGRQNFKVKFSWLFDEYPTVNRIQSCVIAYNN